MLDQLKINLF